MFRAGQKVVCVDVSNTPGKKWMHGDKPTLGKIYTVIGDELIDGEEAIFIDGHENWSFLAWRFRPLVERKTDISIFTRLLAPSREKEAV
jgi:hypothetical protein